MLSERVEHADLGMSARPLYGEQIRHVLKTPSQHRCQLYTHGANSCPRFGQWADVRVPGL